MRPLDPVTARLFPTFAAYVRWVRRLALVCSHLLLFLAGVAITFLFLGYHQHIATENQGQLIGRVAVLEAQCQRDFPRKFVLTKAAAQVSVQKREEERREP